MKEWDDFNFKIFTELTVPPQVAGIVRTFNCHAFWDLI